MRPVIVVGIVNTERRRDMTGPTDVAKDRTIAPRVGGSGAFRAFIRDELMPEVGRRFRGYGQTAIVGESLAGLFVVETFFLEPGLFDLSIALSPSLWWNGGALVRGAGERVRAEPRLTERCYVATAGDDGLDDAGKAWTKPCAPRRERVTWFYEPRPDCGTVRSIAPPRRECFASLSAAAETRHELRSRSLHSVLTRTPGALHALLDGLPGPWIRGVEGPTRSALRRVVGH